MERKPNQWKIPAQQPSLDEEVIPTNVPENILFCFLGALSAAVIGLMIYQQDILERETATPHRAPASQNGIVNDSDGNAFNPYENFPTLY